jgi:hypothetical protein
MNPPMKPKRFCKCGKPVGPRAAECDNCGGKRRKAANPEKVRKQNRASYERRKAANPEKVRKQQRESRERRKAANPEKFRKQRRASRERRKAANPEKFRKQKRASYERRKAANPEKFRELKIESQARIAVQKAGRHRVQQFLALGIQASALQPAPKPKPPDPMKELTQSIQKEALGLITALKQDLSKVEGKCRKIVALLDKAPGLPAFLHQHNVPEPFLDLIERVGRGQMTWRLLFLPCPASERLMRLPLAAQERLIATGVEVARLVGDEIKMCVKPVVELTRAEAEIALNSSGNVPQEVQREALQDRLLNKTFKAPAYSLKGDELLVRRDTRIPFADLERLFRDASLANQAKKQSLEGEVKRRQIERA